ncbi:MAG TPA: hypothetical protein VK593_06955 [Edaphobacter sp.]|nr:hypothetical protein [Edaphobacter sp.]
MRLFCLLFVLATLLTGMDGRAQESAASKDKEVEELRQTVRDLAARVTTLEEQLHKQTATAAPPASIPPVAPNSAATAVVSSSSSGGERA